MITKKTLVVLSLLLVAALAVGFSSSLPAYAKMSGAQGPVIVIDAGHGDFDPGASSGAGTREKDVNLAIALKLRDVFTANGHTVVMTRTDDTTLAKRGPHESGSKKADDTKNRVFLADSFEDSVLISIHQNIYSSSSSWGTQVFYGTENPKSELLAKCIQSSVISKLQPDNKREIKRGTSSIYLLVHTKAPTVLVECGFLSSPSDEKLLLDEEYQKKLAYCIYLGFYDYQNAKE